MGRGRVVREIGKRMEGGGGNAVPLNAIFLLNLICKTHTHTHTPAFPESKNKNRSPFFACLFAHVKCSVFAQSSRFKKLLLLFYHFYIKKEKRRRKFCSICWKLQNWRKVKSDKEKAKIFFEGKNCHNFLDLLPIIFGYRDALYEPTPQSDVNALTLPLFIIHDFFYYHKVTSCVSSRFFFLTGGI